MGYLAAALASASSEQVLEHLIRNEKDFKRYVDYVHVNPVKHGLVKQVSQWPYSSFHRYVDKGIYPANWCGDEEVSVAGDD